jgi:hypothetical protein
LQRMFDIASAQLERRQSAIWRLPHRVPVKGIQMMYS